MLTLRQAQVDALRDARWRGFAQQAGDWLRREAAVALAGLDEAGCRRRIDWALQCARETGASDGALIATFAACLLRFGPPMLRHQAVRALLSREGLTPDQRLRAVLDGLPRRIWDELALLAPRADWREIAGGGGGHRH